jgi:hypothetical protein
MPRRKTAPKKPAWLTQAAIQHPRATNMTVREVREALANKHDGDLTNIRLVKIRSTNLVQVWLW